MLSFFPIITFFSPQVCAAQADWGPASQGGKPAGPVPSEVKCSLQRLGEQGLREVCVVSSSWVPGAQSPYAAAQDGGFVYPTEGIDGEPVQLDAAGLHPG